MWCHMILGQDDLLNTYVTLTYWFPKDLLTGIDPKSTPGHGNSIPLPTPFIESEVGKFHQL